MNTDYQIRRVSAADVSRRLVTIDLAGADLALFEAYEAAVLPLLATHGGLLEMRVRAIDGSSETHLLSFPDADAHERYRRDPARIAAQPLWERSRATSTAIEVNVVEDSATFVS